MEGVHGIPEIVSGGFPGIDAVGRDCRIATDVSVYRMPATRPGIGIRLGNEVWLFGHTRLVIGDPGQHPDTALVLGDRVVVNCGCYLSGEGGLHIGDEVLIGPQAKLLSAGHGCEGQGPVRGNPLTYGRITIGRGAWIAAGATVLEGVTIGEGAVVGAGSVVTRDVPPLAVVVGNPARLVRIRGAMEAGV